MPRQLHLGGFQMASHVTHSHGAWRHPGSHAQFTDADYYKRIARTLERGKFDFTFFADGLAIPYRFGDDIEGSLRRGTQASAGIDPMFAATVMASVTDHLGVAITKSTTYFHPFELARSFASLDHLSDGRAAWNIVTSVAQAEAQNFGAEDHLEHELRYLRAQEFVETTVELWGSWAADALVLDKESGVFADPSKVHAINHHGEFFDVRGPLNVPRSPAGRPVLIQAGASNQGRDFAARWAEVIFEIDPTPEGRRAYYDDIKSRVSDHGRDPGEAHIMPAAVTFVAETESIAREKQAFHNELCDPISGLVTLSTHTDHDFSQYDLDAPIEEVEVPGAQGLFAVAHRLSRRDSLTLRDVGALYAQGVMLPQFVGTAGDVADQIEEGFHHGECDGWMISAAQHPASFDDFVDYVVPELQRRGHFRREYEGRTLRDHLGLAPAQLGAAAPAA
jgi:FMN-dependent oxidoreductase (nitrilotriacetate monooxygenase family)